MMLALPLSGCQPTPADPDELFAEAKQVNATFKEAVGQVQLQILDGEWTVDVYGDIPRSCDDDGYEFRMVRSTPDGTRIGTNPMEAAKALGEWMDGAGWTDIALRTYTNGIDNVVLVARNTDAHVKEITIDYNPGRTTDHIDITAESTCQPGSWETLTEELLPGWPTSPGTGPITRPALERPDAKPLFGFHADATPRD